MIPIIECCPVIQGEGMLMGRPHILIRMSGCPLRCEFRESKCDTPYASWNPEKGKYDLDDINRIFLDHKNIRHVMITGGEPTANTSCLSNIIEICMTHGKHITVETAGFKYFFEAGNVDLMSLSPKLGNSDPSDPELRKIHILNRMKYDDMKLLIKSAKSYQLKFVISSEDDIYEAMTLASILGADRDTIWFMPEGSTGETIDKNRKWLYERCLSLEVNYSDRLHMLIYPDGRRGV